MVDEGTPQASRILYCRRCSVGYGSIGEIPAVCPSCNQPTRWSPMAPATHAPIRWTADDLTFMKTNKIRPD